MKAIRQLHSAIFEQIILPSRLTNADGIGQNKKISQNLMTQNFSISFISQLRKI